MAGTLKLIVFIQMVCYSIGVQQNKMMKKPDILDYPNATISVHDSYVYNGKSISISNAINMTIADTDIYRVHPETAEFTLIECPNLQFEDQALYGLT